MNSGLEKECLNVLAIEDDKSTLKLYKTCLERCGHQAFTAKTGQGGLELIKTQDLDMVFLDLFLPDMNGLDLLRKIRGENEWVPVVIVTGNPSLESLQEAVKLGGVYEYILKPFLEDDVRLAIKRVKEKYFLMVQNKRLLNKLENTNKALADRVDELEQFAQKAVEYEKEIGRLTKRIEELERGLKGKL